MIAEEAVDLLFDDVCRTLARVGFDIASVNADEGTGLRVRREPGAVIVGWMPGQELDPAGRRDAEYEGIRGALRKALWEILTQAGYTVQIDRPSGEVRVTPT